LILDFFKNNREILKHKHQEGKGVLIWHNCDFVKIPKVQNLRDKEGTEFISKIGTVTIFLRGAIIMRLANDCIYVWSEYHKGLEVGCVFDIKSIPLI
jgi:hypothetical protein